MNLVQSIKENRLLKPIYFQLVRIMEVVPYYLYEEGLHGDRRFDLKPKLDNISVEFLNVADINAIASHPEVDQSEEELIKRLNTGCLCLGAKSDDVVAAYTWCDLRQCSYDDRLCFPLKDNEAYLFDARTFKDYRGKALAPYLRYQLYIKLAEIGRSKYYSTTSMFNTSAVRFKEKLNARIVRLYLFIRLFQKVRINIPIRTYSK